MKKLFVLIVVAALVAAAAIFIYRYQILQYSAETFIRKAKRQKSKVLLIRPAHRQGRLLVLARGKGTGQGRVTFNL